MLKAVIIDDETAAINALQLLMKKHTPEVEVVGHATKAREGITLIETHSPDIVFLDVSMPDMSGFALLKEVGQYDFHLVFTTAHERFAIQAIKHQAADYLLKPIDIDELKTAVERILLAQNSGNQRLVKPVALQRLQYSGRIALPVKEGVIYLPIADIVWVESDGNYSTFHTVESKKYLVAKNIGEYEQLLPDSEFFRAHKSHLLNIRKVKKFVRTDGYFAEMEGGARLEIARRKKEEFLQVMNKFH